MFLLQAPIKLKKHKIESYTEQKPNNLGIEIQEVGKGDPKERKNVAYKNRRNVKQ